MKAYVKFGGCPCEVGTEGWSDVKNIYTDEYGEIIHLDKVGQYFLKCPSCKSVYVATVLLVKIPDLERIKRIRRRLEDFLRKTSPEILCKVAITLDINLE